MFPFERVLDLGEQKEVAGGNILRVGWMFHNSDIFLGQNLPYFEGRLCRRIVMMQPPRIAPQLWSLLPNLLS
jgi:hypothetical protein